MTETRKQKKQRKQLFSKRRGLIAYYAKKLRAEAEEKERKEQEAALAKSAQTKETSTVVQTSAGQTIKNNPELAEWTKSRKTALRKKKKEAMARWSMATGGGGFRGK